jgi:hydroxypyruvate reductase
MGVNALILTTSLRGEARETAVFLASILREIATTGNPINRPACIIAGGETTVTLKGGGKGGRNQELALAAVTELKGIKNIALVTLATDGEDGPTDSAGAIVTGETFEYGLRSNLDPKIYLGENNSYEYFVQTGNSIIIGPTGTNVNDIAFLFAF